MQSGDRRGQSSKQPGHEPQPGENVPLDVPTLLRMAADAEVGVLRTDLQSATTSIRQLETSVTTEFENMKKLIKGPGYNDEEPQIGGGSPYRLYFPYCGPDHDVRGAFVPPAKGNASAPVYAASTASPGVSKSGEDNVLLTSDIGSMRIQGHRVLSPDPPQPSVLQMEFSESAAVDVDSHGGPLGDKDTESMGPVPSNVEPPLAQSTGCRDHVVVEPMETHPHDSHEARRRYDPLPTVSESHTVPDVSGVVNQILSDAGISKELPHPSNLPGNVVGGQCQSSKFGTRNEQQELPHPSPAPANVAAGPSVSSKFVPENEKETISVGSETHGSDPVEEPSELGVEKNDEGVGDVPAADDAAGAGARRVSFQACKKERPVSSNPTPPTRVLPVFIGGFNAFAPPTPENRDAFLKRLNAANGRLQRFRLFYFKFRPSLRNGVCSHEALDRVVTFICNRRDRLPSARFEFVPPSFFLELMRNYAGFDAIKEKHKFAFSTLLNHSLCTVLGVSVLLEHPGFSGVAALILLDMVAADQPLNRLSLTEEEVRVAAENYAIASLSMG
ncbi:hypothetical protein Bca4012_103244 [Brassica carinata]